MSKHRHYMKEAYEEMLEAAAGNASSIDCCYVGAILVKDGKIIARAHQRELKGRERCIDLLLDKLPRDITFTRDDVLYVTLEPSAPESCEAGEISSAERIVEAGIKTVFFGMYEPDPRFHERGLVYLMEHGLDVGEFHLGFDKKVYKANEAYIRKFGAHDGGTYIALEQDLEEDISYEAVDYYCLKAKLPKERGYVPFWDRMIELGLIEIRQDYPQATDMFMVFFGKTPSKWCPGAEVLLEVSYSGDCAPIEAGEPRRYWELYQGPMLLAHEKVLEWLEAHARDQENGKWVAENRKALLEAAINSIVHRDYGNNGILNRICLEDRWIKFSNPASVSAEDIRGMRNFVLRSKPRNDMVAALYEDMDLMNKHRGMAILKSVDVPPHFAERKDIFAVYFPMGIANRGVALGEAYGGGRMEDKYAVLYDFVRTHDCPTIEEVSTALSGDPNVFSYDLDWLGVLDIVVCYDEKGDGETRYWAK